MEWFKVVANYYDDLAVHKVGERGEILFLRSMAWSAGADTEGFIPYTQLTRFGLRQMSIRVAALVMVGLWVEVDGGYQIKNWSNIQSEAYAAERKRLRDRRRVAAQRSVARQSRDMSLDVAALEVEEERTPLTPSAEGESCTGQHDNCRGCRTTRRQLARAARVQRPVWCGVCNEQTRLVGYDSDSPSRCGVCHPLRGGVASSNIQLDAG